jgi:hypothetical protein
MQGPEGKEIPPTGKSFEVDFCTVARWADGEIVEENLSLRPRDVHAPDRPQRLTRRQIAAR